jgi:hypothetical protein
MKGIEDMPDNGVMFGNLRRPAWRSAQRQLSTAGGCPTFGISEIDDDRINNKIQNAADTQEGRIWWGR